MVKEVTEAEFEAEILKSKEPVLVDMFTNTCPPCRALSPIIDEIASEGRIKIVKLNVGNARNIAASYSIFSVPTLMIFASGKSVDSIVGLRPKEQLIAWIEKIKSTL